MVSRNDYLVIEQERIEKAQDLAAQKQRRQELSATPDQIKKELKAYQAEFTNNALAQLAEAERKLNGLQKSAIQVGEKMINLSPGMAVTVEVKTGKRRLIEYIFSPLMQYVDESVRER